jgi:hypothetical protein
MIGFELKFRGQVISLPPEAITTVTLRRKEGKEEIWFTVGMYEPDTCNCVEWLKSDLIFGDEIGVCIKDITETTAPVEIYNFYEMIGTTKEKSDKRTLDRFLNLEKELKKKELI